MQATTTNVQLMYVPSPPTVCVCVNALVVRTCFSVAHNGPGQGNTVLSAGWHGSVVWAPFCHPAIYFCLSAEFIKVVSSVSQRRRRVLA